MSLNHLSYVTEKATYLKGLGMRNLAWVSTLRKEDQHLTAPSRSAQMSSAEGTSAGML